MLRRPFQFFAFFMCVYLCAIVICQLDIAFDHLDHENRFGSSSDSVDVINRELDKRKTRIPYFSYISFDFAGTRSRINL